MMIKMISKEEIFPAFGYCYPDRKLILLRTDLPSSVQKFVLEHEKYHLTDPVKFWLWREIRANWHAAIKHPWGFIATSVMSLAPSRLWYYAERFMKAK